jgi:cysteine-rich repeat protein
VGTHTPSHSHSGGQCDEQAGRGYEFIAGTYAKVDDGDVVNFWFSAAFVSSETIKKKKQTDTRNTCGHVTHSNLHARTHTEFTFQVWMKPYNVHSELRQSVMGSLIDRPKAMGNQYFNSGIQIIDGHLHLVIGIESCTVKVGNVSITSLENRWFHVTTAYDANMAGGTVWIFINGELVVEQAGVGSVKWTGVPFFIARAYDTDWNYAGQLDEIRVWNFAMTQDDVNKTWASTLQGNENGLELYANAEGDPVGWLFDKSHNHRNTPLIKISDTAGANEHLYLKANCVGCFNFTGLRCYPTQEGYSGFCGDGLVLGEEECDGGEGCSPNCTCLAGWDRRGLPYCVPAIPASCTYSAIATDCASILQTSCDCDCMETVGVPCVLDHGCDITKTPLPYVNFLACIAVCPSRLGVCFALFPEYCRRWETRESCMANNCTWCVDSCTTLDANCPRFCGDGRILGLETCDDGNSVSADGCTNCTIDEGWTCVGTSFSVCSKPLDSSGGGLTGSEIAGIVIASAVAALFAIGVFIVLAIVHKKSSPHRFVIFHSFARFIHGASLTSHFPVHSGR